MNARTLDLITQEVDEASLLERARSGDIGASAALLDEVAPDVYGEVLLEVGDAREAQRITDEALIAAVQSSGMPDGTFSYLPGETNALGGRCPLGLPRGRPAWFGEPSP